MLRGAGACHLPRGPLGRLGPLALVSGGPVSGGWSSGTGGPDLRDVLPAQGIPDAEGRHVMPQPVHPVQVVRRVGPHVCHKGIGHIE